ncbi:MAG: primosomal protein N' [Pseudomonadota bacterium]
MSPTSILRIALPGPIRSLFDYLPPIDQGETLIPGIRLQVPFGRTSRCGVLIEIDTWSKLPAARLKRIESVIDRTPLLDEAHLAFLLWAANYYQHPLGDVVFHAFPVRLRKGQLPTSATAKGWRLTPAGAAVDPTLLHRAYRQAAILTRLKTHPEGLVQQQLIEQCGDCRPSLRSLREKQWIEPCEIGLAPTLAVDPAPSPVLSEAQSQAVNQVAEQFNRFKAFLLDGVTGSGKTEVYLNLIEQVLQQGQQVLVLVPEIGLTPQLVRRFEQRLGLTVTLLHSGLSDGERERAWLAAGRAEARLLVGTRSAIFTPMPRLGLIIVDEEHDLSYKQQEGFRYSARDLAVVRARRTGCPILLGSATPSLESLHNSQLSRYRRIPLLERVGKARLPKMEIIDIRSSRLEGGLSPVLISRINSGLRAGEQVMLFLNRRGYAPLVTCHACGWLSDCPRCDARMTLHLVSKLLWCHHCGHQQKIPSACPSCGSPDLRPLGQGTERLESALTRLFPDHSVARIDRDSTSRKGSLEKLLKEIRAGHHDLLIGTQMLAKGHHFPNVTLVGLLDVDQGLFGADYRAAERMAQLIIQVAGRAGRAEKPGRVLIQTRHPDHPLLQTLILRGYSTFAQDALAERQLASLPPFSYQALLRAESTRQEDPINFLTEAATAGRALQATDGLEFWGPVPAPMERRAGKIRAHLLVQVTDRAQLHRWLDQWTLRLAELPGASKVRWSLDVDPQEML